MNTSVQKASSNNRRILNDISTRRVVSLDMLGYEERKSPTIRKRLFCSEVCRTWAVPGGLYAGH